MTHKNKADVKSVDKWLTYCMIVGYKVINQGRCFSQKDPKAEYLSDKMTICSNRYTACGIDEFDKMEDGDRTAIHEVKSICIYIYIWPP